MTTVADSAGEDGLSLADAIRLANESEGPDEIVFNLPAEESEPLDPEGGGDSRVFVFRPLRPLAFLADETGGTTIDGTSQSRNGGDINSLGPEIVLDGSLLEFATGLVLASDSNVVRGLTIQQFAGDALHLRGNDNLIVDNYLGAAADGGRPAGNDAGVVVFGNNNRIGTAAEPNVISGNRGEGIVIFGHENLVMGNRIGIAADGFAPLGNGSDGISISNFANQNQIGDGATGGNTIAFNGRNGVTVAVNEEGAVGNSIRGNSIHSNTALGIDLAESSSSPDGVTPNDSQLVGETVLYDVDDGANRLQNFPELGSVVAGQLLQIQGNLFSHANQAFTIDFYANDSADPSGFGEGQHYLGAIQIETDASGQAVIDVELPADASSATILTATATDSEGNTSEFSAAIAAVATRSISGAKYRDLSGNGFSEDDLPLSGVTIELYRVIGGESNGDARELIASTVTGADGSYRFDELSPSIYVVEEVIDEGFVQTAGGNEGNSYYTIDLGIESERIDSTGNDFANFRQVTISGFTWEDQSGDGLDESDRPRTAVTVELYADDGDGQFDTALDARRQSVASDERGVFVFEPLGPGLYFVLQRSGDDAIQTFGGDSFPNIPFVTVNVGDTDDPSPLNFGSFVLIQLEGQAVHDLSGDGRSQDDPPLSGVLIELLRDDGNGQRDSQDSLVASVVTDDLGRFAIDGLGPGRYFVQQIVPDGFVQTGGGDEPEGFYTVLNRSDEDRNDLVFANAALPTLAGTLWDDRLQNGQIDEGEPGLAGWTVVITDASGSRMEVVTDAIGRYSAAVLPGSYRVAQLVPPGWETTFPLGRFDTHQAVPAGVVAGLALAADVVVDPESGEEGALDLIIVHDVESPLSAQGSVWVIPGRRGSRLPEADALDPIRIELGANARVRSATSADLDGDGDLDLAVAAVGRRRTGGPPTGSIIILRNEPQGLEIHQVLNVSDAPGQWNVDGPIDLVPLDANGDGRLDLATVDFRSHTVSLLHGVGEGRFEVAQVFASGSLSPSAIAAADVDGDGRDELLVAHHAADTLVMFQADAAGGYQPVQRWNIARPADVAIADLDSNGWRDVLIAGVDGLSILWNDTGRPAGAPQSLVPGRSVSSMAVGDVNHDGTLDVVVALPNESSIAVLFNLGQRQFAAEMPFAVERAGASGAVVPASVALADLDGDEDLDVVAGLAVGGACVLWNEPAIYPVEVDFQQSADQLNFANVFVGLATAPGSGGEPEVELSSNDEWPLAESAVPSASAVDVLLGADDDALYDVNGDGYVSPLDALLVIQRLNQSTVGDNARWDVNRDGSISPLDALLIVNRLNSPPR